LKPEKRDKCQKEMGFAKILKKLYLNFSFLKQIRCRVSLLTIYGNDIIFKRSF